MHQFVVDPIDIAEIYVMYKTDWEMEMGHGLDEKVPSITCFRTIWSFFKKLERVRIRQV
jgi:hypothetical protein